jgi:hypothetical protein
MELLQRLVGVQFGVECRCWLCGACLEYKSTQDEAATQLVPTLVWCLRIAHSNSLHSTSCKHALVKHKTSFVSDMDF